MAGALHYFLQDIAGYAAASFLALLLLVLPGFGLAALGRRTGLIGEHERGFTCWGLVLATALLPAIDALLLRWMGMAGVLLPHAVLATIGAPPVFRAALRMNWRWGIALAVAWLAVAWANVDVDWSGRLYQPLTAFDTVKHAIVVATLADQGVPFADPFFARPAIAGYYYYFYIGPALIHWLGMALVDSRAAFAAATFVTMLAFPAMLLLVADRAALIARGAQQRFTRLTMLLCCVSGFQILAGLVILGAMGITLRQLETWTPEVRWVLTSVLWVPHHLTALIAVFVGGLALTRPESARVPCAAVAGVAFATAFGCSVWIAIAAAVVLATWWALERGKEDRAQAWAVPLAGVVAAFLLLAQFHDIAIGRAPGPVPLAFTVQGIGPDPGPPGSAGDALLRLALEPFAYLIQYGVFALGAFAFLTRGGLALSRSTPTGRLLLCAAVVGLLLATFVRSTIIYNDFGWRAMWFAQLPTLLWTAAALSTRTEPIRSSALWSAALALGLATTAWDLVGLRLIREPGFKTPATVVNGAPEVDYEVRGAYAWIDRTLPRKLMVQHNPGNMRGIDFGLYSDRPVALADFQARLFGASEAAVRARLELLGPIYRRPMPLTEIQARASQAGVGAILLTSADPVWRRNGGPPRQWTCAYATQHTCLMLTSPAR